jgi:large subunit ribosomal protein L5
MALQELPSALRQLTIKQIRQTTRRLAPIARRYASGEATATAPTETPISEDLQDLEPDSSFTTRYSAEAVKDYDPIKRSKARKSQLPASRYVDLLRFS